MTTYVSSAASRGVNWDGAPGMSTALFRTWCGRVKAALDGCGLVQTSDTGQLDPATVNAPGSINSDAGSLIYRFNDTVQGADPLFLRIYLGRGVHNTFFCYTRMRVQIGQGSNGSGALTGNTSPVFTAGDSYTNGSIDPATTDYACHTEGFFALIKDAIPVANNGPPRHAFAIQRTRNADTGAFDADGYVILTNGAGSMSSPPPNSAMYHRRFSVGNQISGDAAHGRFCLPVMDITTDVDGDYIAWPHMYYDQGYIRSTWATWTAHASSFPFGVNTIVASPYGTPRTWLAIGDANGRAFKGIADNTSNWAAAILWE